MSEKPKSKNDAITEGYQRRMHKLRNALAIIGLSLVLLFIGALVLRFISDTAEDAGIVWLTSSMLIASIVAFRLFMFMIILVPFLLALMGYEWLIYSVERLPVQVRQLWAEREKKKR